MEATLKTSTSLAFLLLAATAGCTTISAEELRARDEAECRSYGFNRNNDAFAECLQRIELDRRANRRALHANDPWRFYAGGIVFYR